MELVNDNLIQLIYPSIHCSSKLFLLMLLFWLTKTSASLRNIPLIMSLGISIDDTIYSYDLLAFIIQLSYWSCLKLD